MAKSFHMADFDSEQQKHKIGSKTGQHQISFVLEDMISSKGKGKFESLL